MKRRIVPAVCAAGLMACVLGAAAQQTPVPPSFLLPDELMPRAPAPASVVRSPLLPVPTLAAPRAEDLAGTMPMPATADAAYGAYQRGYYLSALRIAEPLANLGDSAAQTLLGELYLRGLGVPRDEEEAARWYRVAADAGVPQAQFRYAMMLIEGEGVERDPARARELMREAADGGEPEAAFNYGQMLIQASPTGGFAQAYPYFERAALSGVADGQYALSQLYAYGQGVAEASDTTARRWLHAAAVKGHDTAQVELGIWLINGRGGPADAEGGFRWLKGAAEKGNAIAFNRVAHLYRDGIGTSRDSAEAAKWAVLARRAGNADAALDAFLRGLPEDAQRQALEAANRFVAG